MRLSPKAATLLTLAAIMLVAPIFFPSAYYFRIASVVYVNAIAVLGMVILTGYAGQISLGHAGFAGIGGYACALAPVYLGVNPALGAALGGVVSGALWASASSCRWCSTTRRRSPAGRMESKCPISACAAGSSIMASASPTASSGMS